MFHGTPFDSSVYFFAIIYFLYYEVDIFLEHNTGNNDFTCTVLRLLFSIKSLVPSTVYSDLLKDDKILARYSACFYIALSVFEISGLISNCSALLFDVIL